MTDEIYTVEINGPAGRKIVTLPADQVRYFTDSETDAFGAAVYLAYCDLWAKS